MNNGKIIIALLLSLCLMVFGAACGDDSSDSRGGGGTAPGVSDVLEQGMAEADGEGSQDRQPGVNENAPAPEEISDDATLSSTEGIDIDLTELSSTMVYSEVYNMITEPDTYLGKVIRMEGPFAFFHDETSDKYYYACIISDATACCSQGIEFEPVNAKVFPDDFPEQDTVVTVTGTFDTYEENGYVYCTLRDAVMEI